MGIIQGHNVQGGLGGEEDREFHKPNRILKNAKKSVRTLPCGQTFGADNSVAKQVMLSGASNGHSVGDADPAGQYVPIGHENLNPNLQ